MYRQQCAGIVPPMQANVDKVSEKGICSPDAAPDLTPWSCGERDADLLSKDTDPLPKDDLSEGQVDGNNDSYQGEVTVSPPKRPLHSSPDKLPKTIAIQPYSHECEGADVLLLLERLKHDKVAKDLYLTNVPLGERGAVLVAEMLGENKTLETLYMNGSGISDCGVVLIAFALEANTTLKKLSLNDNSITDKGMETLGHCLSKNTTLQELKLGNNNVTKLGRCWGKVNVLKMNLYGNPIMNVPRKYLGERRVSNCKMHPLKKFLKESNDHIDKIEKCILPKSCALPNQDDMWRLKTIGYHNEFRDWLEWLLSDHEGFYLIILGMNYDPECKLKFLRHGYAHLVRKIFGFLLVGSERDYDFGRARKALRVFDGLKLS